MKIQTISLLTILSAGFLSAADLTITAPLDGSPAAPGQALPVTVTANGAFTEVVVAGNGPIGFSKVITAAPYQASLTLPAGLSPGRYSLTAIGVTASGAVYSSPISISVERTDAPVEFHVTPQTLSLAAGNRMPLRIVSTYADGSMLDTTHSIASSFSSNTPGVATVDSQGNVTAVGPGSARIMVNNSLSIPVNVSGGLTVAPEFPVVYASQAADFSAFRPGMAPVSVNWTINPQVGSISQSGIYTGPKQVTQQQLVTVTATLKSDATLSASTQLVLFPPVSVSVFPSGPVTLSAGQTQRFGQDVFNALDENVDWSISPKNVGSIDSTGLYTAPATIKNQTTVTITATSVADPSKSGTANVVLN